MKKIEEQLKQKISSQRWLVSWSILKKQNPKEIFIQPQGGYVISCRRLLQGYKNNTEWKKLEKEIAIALKLARAGQAVGMLTEFSNRQTKNPDAVVDGILCDFKECNFKKICEHFKKAMQQADSVAIHLIKEEPLSRIFGKLKPTAKLHYKKNFLVYIITENAVKMKSIEEIIK